MYLLKRVTTVPASPLTIQVDGIRDDSGEGNFQGGGVYLFQPAGQDEDRHQVSEHAARAIMSDPGIAFHFTCDPDLKLPDTEPAAAQVDEQPDGASDGKRRRKTSGKG